MTASPPPSLAPAPRPATPPTATAAHALPRRARVLIAVIDLAGGTGAFCRLLATGLRRFHGDEFDVAALLLRDRDVLPADRDLFRPLTVVGADVHADWRRLVETPVHALRLARAVRASDADLLFGVGTYANLLAPLGAAGRPALLSVHVPTSRQLATARFGAPIATLLRWGYRGRTVVAPADAVADDLRRRFGLRDVRVLPHGVDLDRVRRLADEPSPPADLPRNPYAVAVGRLSPEKGFDDLLRAYAAARALGMADDLLFVGDGPERPALQTLARDLGVADHVHLVGRRDNPFPYVRRARFLALASHWEGFGLVLVEAMALGVPCLAIAGAGGPDHVLDGGRHGLLVPRAGLADALARLSRDEPLRQRLAGLALQRAEQLSLRAMAAGYRALFRAALGRKPREARA